MERNLRLLSAALLAVLAAAVLPRRARGADEPIPLTPPEIEEASSVAVHTADALARGRSVLLREALDELSFVGSAVGPAYLTGLTDRQVQQISARLVSEMAGPFIATRSQHGFTHVLAAGGANAQAVVTLLMPSGSGDLKADWKLRLRHGEWRVEDIVLSDTGRSVRQEAIAALGNPPLARWRKREAEAKQAGLPRAAGLVAVGIVTLVFVRRLRSTQRWVVISIAAVPAILFAVDGALAVSRIWSEPVEVRLSDTTPRNRHLHRFQQAVTQKNIAEAAPAAADAMAAGASPGPLHLVLGRLQEELGQIPQASREYQQAVSSMPPAPGGWAGLARIAFEQRNYAEAVADWDRYLAGTAPDPTSLVLKASALGHAGDTAGAQVCLEKAIEIDPSRPEAFDLSSRIAAVQGDEATAISRLRDEEKLRGIDRDAIARDPTFSLLSEKAAWKAFLAEKPPARRIPG